MASNTLPAKDLTEVNVSIDDVSTAGPLCSLCFCDSVIYNIIMHAVIIGTVVSLFYHLQKNNEYFSTISFLILSQFVAFIFQLMCVKNWPEALLYGGLSHVFGVTAIFLLLRLISPVLAMRTCIPILSWVGITFIYQAISCCCKAVELDMKAERDAANLV
ncbi:unnamed protein product [Brassica oleracea var. botrytis]